jgi:hypothetical protein
MVTKLDRTLKREITVKGRPYVLSFDDKGMKLTLKGHRKGQELLWDDFVTGEAAFATALNASLALANDAAPTKAKAKSKAKSARPKKRRRA